jgi:hypothetical protein
MGGLNGVDAEVMPLPADGRAAGVARAVVRDRLRGWGLEDLVDVAVLLTSELIANVVVHTGSAPGLRLDRDGPRVRVGVLDASPVPPRHRRHSARAATGRGLDLVADLSDDWGWSPFGDGKEVWFLVGGGPRAEQPQADGSEPEPRRSAFPLGRYGPAGGGPEATDPTVTVCLLGVPVRVLAASREHHDGLMREFRLLAMSGATDRAEVPAQLAALTRELGVRFAAARTRPDADFDRAFGRGLDTVDLEYPVSPAVVDGARQLQVLMDQADELCRAGLLMTLPRTPVVRRFGQWYIDEILRQVAGHAASRWDGPWIRGDDSGPAGRATMPDRAQARDQRRCEAGLITSRRAGAADRVNLQSGLRPGSVERVWPAPGSRPRPPRPERPGWTAALDPVRSGDRPASPGGSRRCPAPGQDAGRPSTSPGERRPAGRARP